jgi:hypothetical protein
VSGADGTVTGQAEVNNPSFPIRVHFAIDCLEFDGGNRVIARGPVTPSSDPGTIAVGGISVFAVEDNGEGANAPPDRITTIPDYDPPKSCTEFSVSGSGLRDDAVGVLVRPWRDRGRPNPGSAVAGPSRDARAGSSDHRSTRVVQRWFETAVATG